MIGFIIRNTGPGKPYKEIRRETGIFRGFCNHSGKRFYMQSLKSPCSKTWLSNSDAERIMANPEFVVSTGQNKC